MAIFYTVTYGRLLYMSIFLQVIFIGVIFYTASFFKLFVNHEQK